MRRFKKWSALIMVAVMVLGGPLGLCAAVEEGMSPAPQIQSAGQDTAEGEAAKAPDDAGSAEDTPESNVDWVGSGEEPDATGEADEEKNPEESSIPDVVPEKDDQPQGAAGAKGKYVFAIAEPGGEDYRQWKHPDVQVGESLQYDLYLAWYENDRLEIVSTLEEGMGIGLAYEEAAPFSLHWDEAGYHLEVAPTTGMKGMYELVLEYTRPDNGKRVLSDLTIWVFAHDFVIVVSDPGGDNYREWDNPTVHAGENARYALHLARTEDGKYVVEDENGNPYIEGNLWIDSQEDEGFTIAEEADGYYLCVNPEQRSYEIALSYCHPESGSWLDSTLLLNAAEMGEYAFVVIEPGSAVYRLWDDPVVQVGTRDSYALYFARVTEDGYAPVDVSPDYFASLGLTVEQDSDQFAMVWDAHGYYLNIRPTRTGVHTIRLTYRHPGGNANVEAVLRITVWEHAYTFVVADPGSDAYRQWDDPVVAVGYTAQYVLSFARVVEDGYELIPGFISRSGITEHFSITTQGDVYYLNVHPTETGIYSISLNYTHPETGEFINHQGMHIYVVEGEPEDYLFAVADSSGTVHTWREGDVGAVAAYYGLYFDPAAKLRITCRQEDWSLYDPEGILKLISSGPEGATYAMTRPTLETPLELTAGNTTMSLYVLLSPNVHLELVRYDPAYLQDLMGMELLSAQQLRVGEEIPVAIRCLLPNNYAVLYTGPLLTTDINLQVTTRAEPGDRYFTLAPQEEGPLRLRLDPFHKTEMWVGAQKRVAFGRETPENPNSGALLSDGSQIQSATWGFLRTTDYIYEPIGIARLLRSSNPDVLRVELDEKDPSRFRLHPVGFGETLLYIDSDQYRGELRLFVPDSGVNLLARTDKWPSMWMPPPSVEAGKELLPHCLMEGTLEAPFPLPYLTQVDVDFPDSLSSRWSLADRLTSSDPDIVQIEGDQLNYAYLVPVGTGVCTITYREGPFVKEVAVRSEPGALQQLGCFDVGFFTYYGGAHIRTESVSLQDGLSIPVGIVDRDWQDHLRLAAPDPARFQFSDPGIARVELASNGLFHLVPLAEGTTTMHYTLSSGGLIQMQVAVELPEPIWDFVVRDESTQPGYRLLEREQVLVGESAEYQVFFAKVVLNGEGDIHTVELADFPEDLTVQAEDSSVFDLLRREPLWFISAAPREAGESCLTITATPPGAARPQTWKKRLFSARPIPVSERSVAAINAAIRSAPMNSVFETVILLPGGYIPIDYHTPVLLDRPVTLRGQNTVLGSDVVTSSRVPGAKLQNLTIRFDDGSACDYDSRQIYPHAPSGNPPNLLVPYMAIIGDGFITLENCELDGGAGRFPANLGIGVLGKGVTFRGANTIRNYAYTGWSVESTPGPRRSFTGLTFEGNATAVRVRQNGSMDPYFIRLTESNFIDNGENVHSPFPVNFAHNYFSGGLDGENITKSPQYMEQMEFGADGTPAKFPSLFIEEDRLAAAELLNFEGRAPIDTANFAAVDEPVQITVRELGDAVVYEEDRSNVLLHWSFSPVQTKETPLFHPDAHIDEEFDLPADSGIRQYQGVSFVHHGPLPMEGAEISVQKRVEFEEDTLYLYRLADGNLTAVGEIANAPGEFYTFHLDGCSDYVITNVVVEAAGGGGGPGDGSSPGGSGSPGGGGSPGDGSSGDGGSPGDGSPGGGGSPGDGSPGGGGSPGGSGSPGDDGGSEGGTPGGEGSGGAGDGGPDRNEGNENGGSAGDGSSVVKPGNGSAANGGSGSSDSENPGENASSDAPTGIEGNHPSPVPGSENRNADDQIMDGALSLKAQADNQDTTGGTRADTAYDYSRIPIPPTAQATPREAAANHYVDEAAIRSAFAEARDGQVVLDVSVKTVVSDLAFQLLAETSSHTLVLKGDGYEWRFSGADLLPHTTTGAFHTAVHWDENRQHGFARLSLTQRDSLPGSCVLVVEATAPARGWGIFNPRQDCYTPCAVNPRRQGNRLALQLDTPGEYVAIF